MGISGCGKSTLGKALAAATGYRFVEGDDLHTTENIAKMSAGIALTDEDRWPWLARVAGVLNAAGDGEGCIVSCSALRRSYRDFLHTRVSGPLVFVLPEVSIDTALLRLHNRPDHYMPPSLVESQMATLEPPEPDEPVLTIDGAAAISDAIALIMDFLSVAAADPTRQAHS